MMTTGAWGLLSRVHLYGGVKVTKSMLTFIQKGHIFEANLSKL